MITEHTVVRSGKSKRKPFNSNVADYLLIIATFLGISLDAGQPCLKSPGFNPRALTAASDSRPHASTFSFGAIIAPIIALAFSDPVRPGSRPSGRANRPLMVQLSSVRPDHLQYLNIPLIALPRQPRSADRTPVSGRGLPKTGYAKPQAGDWTSLIMATNRLDPGRRRSIFREWPRRRRH
jgi:hypothetical protein